MALVNQSQGGSKGPIRSGQANFVLYNLANQSRFIPPYFTM